MVHKSSLKIIDLNIISPISSCAPMGYPKTPMGMEGGTYPTSDSTPGQCSSTTGVLGHKINFVGNHHCKYACVCVCVCFSGREQKRKCYK